MGYHVIDATDHQWEERGSDRFASDLTTQAQLQRSRARIFRYAPGAHGRRHQNFEQEEVFVVLSGTLTMLLGEEAERFDLGPQSVVNVETNTPLQLFNAGDEEVVVFIYGAPPETDQSELLEDLSL